VKGNLAVEIGGGPTRSEKPNSENSIMAIVRKQRPTSMSTITCHKCSHLEALSTTERLPDEFSVRCSSCGYRGFYRTKEIRRSDAEQAIRGEQSTSAAAKAS
jgi:predicted nucleic-acid-binding Zn-ribbon protein